MMQEAGRAEKCYANTDSISKFDNKGKPMFIDKEPNTTKYFLPGSNQDNYKEQALKSQNNYRYILKMYFLGKVPLMEHFPLQEKPDSKPYQEP